MGNQGRDWFNRMKFSAPPMVENIVERAQLQVLVKRCIRDNALTLVHAPAGFGKSTLLAQIGNDASESGAAVAWLTLGEEDRQSDTLALNLSQSLAVAGLGKVAADIGSIVGALENMGTLEQPALLILDEAEHVEGSPVATLLERLGMVIADNVRLLIGARFRPALASAQLRLSARLAVVGPVEMRFLRDDAIALLGASLPRDQCDLVLARAEGWPVILQLARQFLCPGIDGERAMQLLKEPDSDLFRYMAEQIFDRLSPQARQLLTEVAILDRVEPASAAAVTGIDDAYRLLQNLRRLQPIILFDSKLEQGATIHPVFRDFLLERLYCGGRLREHELRLRAAHFHAGNGNVMAAVAQALKAGHPLLAAQIIEDQGGVLLNVSEGAGRVRTMLQQLPKALVAERPRLQLTRLLEMMLNDRVEIVLPALQALRIQLDDTNVALRRDLDYVESVLAFFEYAGADEATSRERLALSLEGARARAADEPRVPALFLPLSVITAQRCAPLRDAENVQGEALDWYAEQQLDRQRPWGLLHQALIDTAAGRYEDAMKILTLLLPDSLQGLTEVQAMLTHTVNALVAAIAYERGDLDLCCDRLARLPPPRSGGMYEILYAVTILKAKSAAAMGERDRALALIHNVGAMATREGLPNIALHAIATRARLLQNMGRAAETRELCSVLNNRVGMLNEEDAFRPWLLRLDSALSFIGLHIADGKLEEALLLAEHLLAVARNHERHTAVAAAWLALARVQYARGESGSAGDYLREALGIAVSAGAIQVFLDQGPVIPFLLRQLAGENRPLDAPFNLLVSDILTSWERIFHHQQASNELFTPREIDILWQLASGSATKVAARNLEIAPETVKHHLKNIFRKLKVHSREDAVLTARRRALIP